MTRSVEDLARGYGEGLDLDAAFHTDDTASEGTAGATRYSVAATTVTDADIRCSGKVPLRSGEEKVCNKLLARQAGRPWVIECPRCRTVNRSAAQSTP